MVPGVVTFLTPVSMIRRAVLRPAHTLIGALLVDETPGTLVLEGVHKSWGDRPAVDGFSLTVAAGHSVALIGPSGCGKSTVLRLIAGLLTPDQGSIRFGDLACVPENYACLRDRLG